MTISTINRRPVLPQLAAPMDDVSFLIEQYLASKSETVKPVTLRVFREKLKYFTMFWQEHGAAVDWLLSPAAFTQFNLWLCSRVAIYSNAPLEWGTRHEALAQLRRWLRWATRQGYMPDIGLVAHVPQALGDHKPYRPAPGLDVWRGMWEQLNTRSPYPLRNRAIFAVLAGTGMRVGECAALRLEDVELLGDDSGFIDIRTSKIGRGRKVAFDSVTGEVIRQYLQAEVQSTGPLFLSSRNRQAQPAFTTMGIRRALHEIALHAGVGNQFTGCHDIRRAFARHWVTKLPGQGHEWLLAKELGHTVRSMTQRYARTDAEDLRQVMTKHKVSLFAQVMG